MSAAIDTRQQLARRYAALAPRERVLVAVMAAAIAFLVFWLLLVRPAWSTLDAAPALREKADAQLLLVQGLATEAKQLRTVPPAAPGQAEQVLKAATDQMNGKGKLVVAGDRATLTVTGATGEDLRQWLLQARGGARVRPLEATLTRAGDGYNGTLVVQMGS